MRLSVRADLGGYASGLDVLADVAAIEISRPFVLLCGPNGSGKTAVLRMLRNATGLSGERGGRIPVGFESPADASACDGDPAKLATHSRASAGGSKPPSGFAGVLDLEALGWRGQRTWMYSARSETALVEKAAFDDDIAHHVSVLQAGGFRKSHGELLVGSWAHAVRFGLGIVNDRDPYDEPGSLPGSRGALFAHACPDGIRPAERWLLLDEPETALHAPVLTNGLCALLHACAAGTLRVFCASHSPIFAAGLARHPKVQVLDLGRPAPWLEAHERMLEAARDPALVETAGMRVAEGMRRQADEAGKAREEAARREACETVRALGKRGREMLLAAIDAAPGPYEGPRAGTKGGFPRSTVAALRERRLIEGSTYGPLRVTLTPAGVAAAALLAERRGKALQR